MMRTLYMGDCLKIMPMLPSQSVDMILTDLPYGTTANAWDCILDLKAMWREYERICKGAIVLFAQTPFDKVLGASNLKNLRYEWIWEKTAATGHLNAQNAPLKAHENILVFYKRLPTYNPIKTGGHRRVVVKAAGTRSSNYGGQSDGRSYDSDERYPRSVLTFAKDKQREALHATQKPVALCEYLIRTYTNPGDLILDSCMGSGSTGVAAAGCGRDFIGIEQDPDIYALAEKRLSEWSGLVLA